MSVDAKPFCLAPWAGIHALPDGLVYPCCMSTFDPENAFGDLNKNTIEDILNSEKAKQFRCKMMANKPDEKACSHCISEEKTGTKSFRHHWNTKYEHTLPFVEKTDTDGHYRFEHFPYIDIRLSSLCNFKCRMCHSGLSSAWLLEDIQYESNYQNSFNSKTGVIEIPQKEKLIKFIIDRIEHVEEIEFAGGEPFLISDYFTLIKEFKRVKNYNVKIRFHTNASSLYCKGEYIPNLLKEFKNVTIMLSIDGYGEVNDYTRKGSIYEKIVANVTALHREIPDVYLRLVPTISIPTVYSVPFLYIDFLRKGLVGHRDIACRPLYGPEYLNIQTLPLEDKLKIVKFYNYFIDNITTKLLQRFPGESVTYVKQEFSSIMNFMLLKNQIEQFNSKRFRESIKRLDIRRDESYEDILPETAHLLSGGVSTYNLDDKYNELKNLIDSI